MLRTTTFLSQERQRLDPIRIVGISASIAFNVAMIALLMRPLEYATPAVEPDTDHSIPVLPVHPPKPPPLKQVPVDKPHPPTARTQPQAIPRAPQPPVITVDSTPVSTRVDPQPPTDTTTQNNQSLSTQPVETSLNAIAAPAPAYPRDALRGGITGRVELELLVGVDGGVLEVRVVRSSGNRQLDNAAREQVLHNWRFQPAMRGGIAVQALGRVPIVFSLDGR